MSRKALIILTGILLLTTTTQAQKDRLAAGLRLTPDGGGATVKAFFDPHLALEGQLNAGGIFALEGQSITAVALIEYHITLPAPNWRIFFGGGAHLGAWTAHYHDNIRRDDFIFGIDGIGGVEYFLPKVPIAFSADFKPAINFITTVDFFPHNMFGAAARFYFPAPSKHAKH